MYFDCFLLFQIVYGITYSDYLANSDTVQTTMSEAVVAVLTTEVRLVLSEYFDQLRLKMCASSSESDQF